MKKIWNDSIILMPNRDKGRPHVLSGMYFSNDPGQMTFELDQTRRDFINSNITIDEGCTLMTDEGSFKITDLQFESKRPCRARCQTVRVPQLV